MYSLSGEVFELNEGEKEILSGLFLVVRHLERNNVAVKAEIYISKQKFS